MQPILAIWHLTAALALGQLPWGTEAAGEEWAIADPPSNAPVCPGLSREHLQAFAQNNTILVG